MTWRHCGNYISCMNDCMCKVSNVMHVEVRILVVHTSCWYNNNNEVFCVAPMYHFGGSEDYLAIWSKAVAPNYYINSLRIVELMCILHSRLGNVWWVSQSTRQLLGSSKRIHISKFWVLNFTKVAACSWPWQTVIATCTYTTLFLLYVLCLVL